MIQADELWFRYEEEQPDVIKGLSLTVKKGELLAVLGGNGTGKTTMLKLLSGLYSPYRGELKVTGRVGALPQDPQALFVKKTVREDLYELLRGSREEQDAQVAYAAAEEPPLPEGIRVLHRSAVGRVITYIVRGSREEVLHRMQALSPLLLEAIPLTLEEIFIYELGGADYAVRDIVL